jgi:hypothetical protein
LSDRRAGRRKLPSTCSPAMPRSMSMEDVA